MKKRNRAKCLKCDTIVESLLPADLQMCKCGNCGVEGGTEAYKLIGEDLSKIVRLEDDNTETAIEGDAEPAPAMPPVKPSRKEIMDTLGMSIKASENLPPNAMMAP